MPISITTRGYIEVWRDGVFVSRHTVETKAVESAISHAEQSGDGEYELRFPAKFMSTLSIRVYNPDTTVPSAPVLTASASGLTVSLSWTAATDPTLSSAQIVSGVVAYRLYRAGVQIVRQTGLTYTDTVPSAGAYVYTVKAEDGAGNLSAAGSATVTATSVNLPPVIATVPNQTATVGTPFSLSMATYTTDPEGDPITYSATNLPPGLTINSTTGLISGTPTTEGTYSATITAVDVTPLSDWERRSTASGVIWAHRFDATDSTSALHWGMDPRNSSGFTISGSVANLTSNVSFPQVVAD